MLFFFQKKKTLVENINEKIQVGTSKFDEKTLITRRAQMRKFTETPSVHMIKLTGNPGGQLEKNRYP